MSFWSAGASAIVWYACISAIAALVFPWIFVAFRFLPDRGYALLRPIAVAMFILPIWFAGNVTSIPFTSWAAVILVLPLSLLGWWVLIQRQDITKFLQLRRGYIIAVEIATLGLFFAYVAARGFNPDVWGTEKPMELAFLSAAIWTNELPIPDPWYAGESINYYYFGYAVFGLIAKLSGASSGIAFNLALGTTFATAIVGAAGVAWNLAMCGKGENSYIARVAAVTTAFLLMFAGNFHTVRRLISEPTMTLHAPWWSGPGWQSSRIFTDTGFENGGERTVISEFPAFSWILGDLHPHLIAYPWLITSLALIANLWLAIANRASTKQLIVASAALGTSIGVLYSANTWDVAIIGLLVVVVLATNVRNLTARIAATVLAVVGTSAIVIAAPFLIHYTPPTGDHGAIGNSIQGIPFLPSVIGSIGFVSWDRTSTIELLVAHGLFIVLAGIVAFIQLVDRKRHSNRWVLGVLSIAVSVLILLGFLTSTVAFAIIGIPIVLLLVLFRSASEIPLRIAPLIASVGFLAVLIVEFVFIRDVFGDRMNTVFKVYFQAWALLAIAFGTVLPFTFRSLLDRVDLPSRTIGLSLIILAILGAGVYTPLSLYHWNNGFERWSGIDGIQYIRINAADEYAAIEWLRQEAKSGDRLIEAPGCSYGTDNGLPHNRISMSIGIPTLIGWDGHQFQWRRQQPDRLGEVRRRIEMTGTVFEQPSSSEAELILNNYEINYIVIGAHERFGYRACDNGPPYVLAEMSEFEDAGWQRVFEQGYVTILAQSTEIAQN